MIGYLGVARETFDINLAKKKFDEAKNLIHSLNPNSKGIDELITNNESAIKAINYFKSKNYIVLGDIVPGAGHNNTNTVWLYTIQKELIELVEFQPGIPIEKRLTIK